MEALIHFRAAQQRHLICSNIVWLGGVVEALKLDAMNGD